MAGKGKSVWEGGHLPGSQLGGVQDSVFAFPLNKRLGVPLGLTPQQRCVALVHGCALWFHLEGDENWIGKDQRASRSCRSTSGHSPGLPTLAPMLHQSPVTCHGELDMGTDLALGLVGRDASVVPCVVSGHAGKVQGPSIVCHPFREAAPICRDNREKLWDGLDLHG